MDRPYRRGNPGRAPLTAIPTVVALGPKAAPARPRSPGRFFVLASVLVPGRADVPHRLPSTIPLRRRLHVPFRERPRVRGSCLLRPTSPPGHRRSRGREEIRPVDLRPRALPFRGLLRADAPPAATLAVRSDPGPERRRGRRAVGRTGARAQRASRLRGSQESGPLSVRPRLFPPQDEFRRGLPRRREAAAPAPSARGPVRRRPGVERPCPPGGGPHERPSDALRGTHPSRGVPVQRRRAPGGRRRCVDRPGGRPLARPAGRGGTLLGGGD